MNNPESNYFNVNRSLLHSDRWLSEPFTRGQAWIDLFGLANHTDGYFRVRGIKINLKRGQLGYSQLTLAKRWKWSRNKVRRYLKELEKDGDIEQQNRRETTLITVKKYNLWQGGDTTNDTTKGQQKDNKRNTNNNEKNEKNEKNILQTEVCKEVPDLLKDKQKHIQIIGLYAKAKQVEFKNKEQQSSFIKRNLRGAKSLVGYDVNRIIETMKHLIDNADFKWTIESVGKYIDEDINKLTNKDEDEEISNFFDKYRK